MNVITSAPAKIILLGEHSVVYGKPALAVPISGLKAFAELRPSSIGSGLRLLAEDVHEFDFVISSLDSYSENPFVTASKLLLNYLSAPIPDTTIVLRSDIPIASGLGSGAALTTALLRALAIATHCEVSPDTLNDFVYETEKLFHGTPSGVDNTVIVYERPVYFVRNQPIEPLSVGRGFILLIADTGVSASTKVSVADVRKLFNADSVRFGAIFDAIGALVNMGRASLQNGLLHELGQIMNSNHALLQDLTVSSPELDKLVTVARSAGAMGAKLSGGGRGGNMIALVEKDSLITVKNALLEAGAIRVYETMVAGN